MAPEQQKPRPAAGRLRVYLDPGRPGIGEVVATLEIEPAARNRVPGWLPVLTGRQLAGTACVVCGQPLGMDTARIGTTPCAGAAARAGRRSAPPSTAARPAAGEVTGVPRKPMPEIPRDEALRLYRGGQSMAALGRRYGVSAEWLAARFREWGEPLRRHAQAQRVRAGQTLAAYRRRVNLPP